MFKRSSCISGPWFVLFALIIASDVALAFKLSPHSTPEERKLAGIGAGSLLGWERRIAELSVVGFTEPVHEEITNRMYGCNGSICAGSSSIAAPVPVLAGVRWNDDPPFRMTGGQARGLGCNLVDTIRFETQPRCWAKLFLDAQRKAATGIVFGPGDAMLYRSHFGDLQPIHAMASRDGELASVTHAAMMDWFEFTWRASLGEFSIDTRLKDIDIAYLKDMFGRTEWRMLELYTLGAAGGLRRSIDDVAFGSLLHTVQDSFSTAHVNREESSGSMMCVADEISVEAPGAILEFYSYTGQDHDAHAERDSLDAFRRGFEQPGNVVFVGRALIRARDQNLPWEEMRGFFECIFHLQNPDSKASSGDL